MKNNFYVVQDY